ncbi:MAG: NAD-dependent epimerase/dehydratase family protein [Chitinophagaceae bacterium]
MPTVLVTGATGFIGNYVVEALLEKGCQVIASSSAEEKAKLFPWFSRVDYVPFNMELLDDANDYYNFFGRPDTMIHLAWEGLPNYKASFHNEVNLPRHFSFLKNMIRNGLKDLSVTGTCFEYGMHEGMLSESMASDPANPYALAKDSLRKLLDEFAKSRPFNFKWIRLFYMFGKGQNPNSLLSQLQKALDDGAETFNMSGGQQVRDYLPVETVAKYIVAIALQNKVQGIINCCSGKPITVKQLVDRYLQERNANIHLNLGHYPYADYEPMSFWGDTKKLKLIT